MDVMQFMDRMDENMRSASPQTQLRIRRENRGLPQAGLAADSAVLPRQIQLFGQRQGDISNETLL